MLKNLKTVKTKYLFGFIIVLFAALWSEKVKAQPIVYFDEPFKNATAPNIVLGGAPLPAYLTADGVGEVVDAPGSGFLRLTKADAFQTGYAYSTQSFPSTSGVDVAFEYYTYDGSLYGADGISFFLFDALSIPSFQIGAFGGSLGYAQRTSGTPADGVTGGYIGIGLDEFGNFAIQSEGRIGGLKDGGGTPLGYDFHTQSSTVTLRGAGSGLLGYDYLTSARTFVNTDEPSYPSATGLLAAGYPNTIFEIAGGGATIDGTNVNGNGRTGGTGPGGTITSADAAYRKVRMKLTPHAGGTGYDVTVRLTVGGSPVKEYLLTKYYYATVAPANLSFGFAASTGSSTNIHEIRNVAIQEPVNEAPIATVPADLSTIVTRNTAKKLTGISFSDVDAFSSTVVATLSLLTPSSGALTATSANGVTIGGTSTALTLTGTIAAINTFIANVADGVLYTPQTNSGANVSVTVNINDKGFTGIDPFGRVGTAAFLEDTKTYVLDVISPPVVADFSKSVAEESTSLAFTAADFNAGPHYTDADGDALTKIKIITLPTHGVLKVGGTTLILGDLPKEVLLANLGTIEYVPTPNYSGPDSFKWNGFDATNYAVLDANVNITVTIVNDPPTSADATTTTPEDITLVIPTSKFTFADAGDAIPNTLSAVKITVLPTAGTLYVDLNDNGLFDGGAEIIATNGTVSKLNLDAGRLKFKPAANAYGNNYGNFNFKVIDNGGTPGVDESVAAYLMTVNVTPVNDPPTSADDIVTTLEDVTVLIPTTKFAFSDVLDAPSPNTLSAVKITVLPAAGTLFVDLNDNGLFDGGGEIIAANGTVSKTDLDANRLRFKPAANGNGNNYGNFNFKVIDNGGTPGIDESIQYLMTINVTAVNDLPVVTDITKTVPEEGIITFAAADFNIAPFYTDVDGDLLTKIKITTLPIHGVLKVGGAIIAQADLSKEVLLAALGSITYTPNLNYNGTDVFKWNGFDGLTYAAADANVNITVSPVNDVPVTVNDSNTTLEDQTLTVLVGAGLLSNDTDVDNDPLTVTSYLVTGDATPKAVGTDVIITGKGTIKINANGSYTFTPAANYNGTVPVITYTVSDTHATSTGTLTLTVTPVNDAPVFTAGSNQSVLVSAGPQTVSLWATNIAPGPGTAADESGQTLTFTVIPDNIALFTTGGQPAISANGTLTYTPSGTTGEAIVTVFVKDNGGRNNGGVDQSTSQSFKITVNAIPAGNTAPVAVADTYSVQIGQTLTRTAANGVLFNDSDLNGDPITAIKLTDPTHGTITAFGIDGSFTYVHNGINTTSDSFTYKVNDGTVDGNTVTVTINITAAGNTPPVVSDIPKSGPKDTPIPFTPEDFKDNFKDDNGDPLTKIKIVSLPPTGTLKLSGVPITTGQEIPATQLVNITYDPVPGFIGGPITFGWNGFDGTDYAVTDKNVNITITAANQPPVVADITKTGGYLPIPFTLADFTGTKFIDPEGAPLVKVKIAGLPANGTLKLSSVNVIAGQEIPAAQLAYLTFTPTVNWSGTTTFPWNGSDGSLYAVANANVNITVTLPTDPTAKIGVAKKLASVTDGLNGSYNVTYLFTTVNYGVYGLENISLQDNLAVTFAGANATVKSIKAYGNLKANTLYDGKTITELLLPASKLTAGEESQVELTVNVQLLLNDGLFQNTAIAEGYSSITGFKVTDKSTNGLKPDPTTAGDVSPFDATPVELKLKTTFVPQGFSPNGDGVNDYFFIQNALNKNVALEVYNRWGNRVYKSNEYRNDWDGRCTEGFFTGRDIPDGTYFYVIVIDKKDKYQGYITINR
jgi:gliding motility-associated-like protein